MPEKTFYRDEIVAMAPRNFDEAKIAAEELKDGNPTIVNFGNLNPEERIWAIHYLNGVIFAIDGKTRDIGNNVFLFTPNNVSVDYES
jgi:cell division inhibitor SepF